MEILDNLRKRKEYSKYIEYLDLRNKGLKKQGQTLLKDFLKDFELQDKTSRRYFINNIYTLAFLSNDYNTYLPVNLVEQVLKPEINDWIKDEPDNPIPYKWSYDFNLIKKSLELNPFDQITLDLFGKMLINKISMNQHGLSSGHPYDGNPNEDINLINFYEQFADYIQSIENRENVKHILMELKGCAVTNKANK
jgi:hypothetical protein